MTTDHLLLTKSGFDLDLAVFLANAALAAYSESIQPEAWAKDNGFTQCTTFDRDNIQGFYCSVGDIALLAFRGTSNVGQWVRDARFLPRAHPWGMVHAGFLTGIENVEPDLAAFDSIAAKAKHIWVTGHSLGGALAVLAAARLQIKGINAHAYTYGQPRVGFSGFANTFAAQLPGRLVRFINQSDIVTRLLPGLLYSHTGLTKRVTAPGALEAIATALFDETDPDPMTDDEFTQFQRQLSEPSNENFEGITDWFADHSMLEYTRLLTDIKAMAAA